MELKWFSTVVRLDKSYFFIKVIKITMVLWKFNQLLTTCLWQYLSVMYFHVDAEDLWCLQLALVTSSRSLYCSALLFFICAFCFSFVQEAGFVVFLYVPEHIIQHFRVNVCWIIKINHVLRKDEDTGCILQRSVNIWQGIKVKINLPTNR